MLISKFTCVIPFDLYSSPVKCSDSFYKTENPDSGRMNHLAKCVQQELGFKPRSPNSWLITPSTTSQRPLRNQKEPRDSASPFFKYTGYTSI